MMEHLFEFYGDDAGWSFEARGMEAAGVEGPVGLDG